MNSNSMKNAFQYPSFGNGNVAKKIRIIVFEKFSDEKVKFVTAAKKLNRKLNRGSNFDFLKTYLGMYIFHYWFPPRQNIFHHNWLNRGEKDCL